MDLVSLVKHHEGFARVVTLKPVPTAVPYLCPAGYWTKGYGHVCRKDDPPITEPEASELLLSDLPRYRAQVLALTSAPLNENQLDALTSFTFNLGSARYRASTLRAVINRLEFDRVPFEMRRWVYGGGKKLKGLELRREDEVMLFLK